MVGREDEQKMTRDTRDMPAGSVLPFAAATLLPAALIAAGAIWGGPWAWGGLAWMTVFAALGDSLMPAAPDRTGSGEFPAAPALQVALALAHFALLPLVVWAVSSGSGGTGIASRVALGLGAGLFFGQVSNSNAHELIHRPGRGLYRLGVAIYVTLLFGHHASAHRLVHHVHVATPRDPNSARAGEGFYAFALRAWAGSFVEGWRADTLRRTGKGGIHPYAVYVGGALACIAAMAAAFGPGGLAVYLLLAAHAQMQLLLSDYVQHYGLARRVVDGRAEPVGPGHSWDAPQPFSRLLMLAAPRHSDHHLHPGRIYPALALDRAATPMLPRSLPVMATLALSPRLWRRVMDRRLAAWQARAGTAL